MPHALRGLKACMVIELHDEASEEAIFWLVRKIEADKQDNGCQLDVVRKKIANGRTLLLISASDFRRRAGAEIFGICKLHVDGYMREFSCVDESNFENYEDDDFITDCEGLYIIKSELDSLRALNEDECVPGHPEITLYPGKSILRKLQSSQLVTNVLCLHNRTKLDKLAAAWYKNNSFFEQPIDEIRNYFGDSVGMYFSFLGFYTTLLIPLVAMIIILFMIFDEWTEVRSFSCFAVGNLIWATVFLEMWKRKSAEVAYEFGSFQKREWEEPRSGYHGPLGINPITEKREPCYPPWKRRRRMCLISGPVIAVCTLVPVWVMFYYFSWDYYFAEKYGDDYTIYSQLMQNLPSILYSCLVLVANVFYRRLATYLTNQENHRLESSYQNHLILKIVLFHFVNNFLCLFYIAFVYNDIPMLRRTLMCLFLVEMILSQALESVVKYWQHSREISKRKESADIMSQIEMDLTRDVYTGTFDDYLELWVQFGNVVLFSCVFPFAAVLAFLNNVVEIKSDAFKLCTAFRRPYSIPTRDIGAWQIAFSFLSYLGVASNCALIFQSTEFQTWFYRMYPNATTVQLLVAFVIVEHILLAARFLLSSMIPSVPEHVNKKVAKVLYKSHQALKRRRAGSLPPTETLRRRLTANRTRRFLSRFLDL